MRCEQAIGGIVGKSGDVAAKVRLAGLVTLGVVGERLYISQGVGALDEAIGRVIGEEGGTPGCVGLLQEIADGIVGQGVHLAHEGRGVAPGGSGCRRRWS